MFGNKNSSVTSGCASHTHLQQLVRQSEYQYSSAIKTLKQSFYDTNIDRHRQQDIRLPINPFIGTECGLKASDKSVFSDRTDVRTSAAAAASTPVTSHDTVDACVDANTSSAVDDSSAMLTGMSRRKQIKPRHLDADDDIGQTTINATTTADDNVENRKLIAADEIVTRTSQHAHHPDMTSSPKHSGKKLCFFRYRFTSL